MYATLNDVITRVPNDVLLYLTDDENEGMITPAAETRIAAAITDGSSEADTYLGQVYGLPLPATPPILHARVLDIIEYRLFTRRGIRPGTADESVEKKYKAAIKWLENISMGKATLPLPSAAGGDSSGVVRNPQKPRITADERIFSRKSLEDF